VREALRIPQVRLPRIGSRNVNTEAPSRPEETVLFSQTESKKSFIDSLKNNKPRAAEVFLLGLSAWYALSAIESFRFGNNELGTARLVDAVVLTAAAGLIFAGEKIARRVRRNRGVTQETSQSNPQ
jgi:hypothetical protein